MNWLLFDEASALLGPIRCHQLRNRQWTLDQKPATRKQIVRAAENYLRIRKQDKPYGYDQFGKIT